MNHMEIKIQVNEEELMNMSNYHIEKRKLNLSLIALS